jgi:hypothetical protein
LNWAGPRSFIASEALSADFVSCATEAQNSEAKTIRFAKRNESFRDGGRKSLESLGALNHHFAESFVFNDLTLVSFRSFLASAFSVQCKPHEARVGALPS